ncbi:hypothetical protein HOY34_02560 [Xinfangfangia sp. D13-10-4-6]|uniref:TMEM43 family protein n=1 Tax=Pseudogemmobacter hezensis TaxID=2737662 RepID=UPI001552E211|nr:TMEM43 family protein [Pseudogemmobacter hezensis]NPD14079.1 hypothetical protein [Pseudogemmobacter hezensis]
MSVEETITQSWGERLKQSVAGIATGATLVTAMVGALFWNEGRAVQTSRSLSEGAGLVVERPADQIDPAFNGGLIHVAGPTSAAAPLQDPDFGLEFAGLRLERKVEMYQWVQSSRTEKSTATGGSETQVTTYSYAPDWQSNWQDPANFKEPQGHNNPQMAYSTRNSLAAGARVGAYGLEDDAIAQLGGAVAQRLSEDQLAAIRARLGAGVLAQLHQGSLYLGRNPEIPAIGDYRITFSIVPLETISVIGRQHDSGIGRYRTDSGNALLMVEKGNRDAKDMFATAQSGNSTTTWGIRAGAVAGLILGFSLILRPLTVLASVLPFLGAVMGFGTGLIAGVMGLSLGLVVIAVAWFAHRPLVSVAALVVVAALALALVALGRKRRATGAATANS